MKEGLLYFQQLFVISNLFSICSYWKKKKKYDDYFSLLITSFRDIVKQSFQEHRVICICFLELFRFVSLLVLEQKRGTIIFVFIIFTYFCSNLYMHCYHNATLKLWDKRDNSSLLTNKANSKINVIYCIQICIFLPYFWMFLFV
jgi:hypothetical protein